MDEESLRTAIKWMMKGINHNDFKDMLADLSRDNNAAILWVGNL